MWVRVAEGMVTACINSSPANRARRFSVVYTILSSVNFGRLFISGSGVGVLCVETERSES